MLSATNITLMGVSLVCLAIFLQPRLLKSPLWRATVTPLASIIGSGFLVAGPILAHAAGTLAWAAMLGLCAIAYLFGMAIRYNIAARNGHGHRKPGSDNLGLLERASDLALSLAYFVSVAYYLNLFAAFGLRLGNVTDSGIIRLVASTVIVIIGILGALGGLKALERLEVGAVGLKLGLIGGLLAALVLGNALAIGAGDWRWPAEDHAHGGAEIAILLGLVILVQGFETSRYLGESYDAPTRIRTMRWAQWMASAIYLVFVLLVTRYFAGNLPEQGGETAIIDMLADLGPALAPLIIAMALASQLSAAVADLNGAGGLLAETFQHRIKVKIGNLVTALAALGITWAADIYRIIAYASKAFVAYYALQCALATIRAWRAGDRGQACLFVAGIAIALIVIVFAEPANA